MAPGLPKFNCKYSNYCKTVSQVLKNDSDLPVSTYVNRLLFSINLRRLTFFSPRCVSSRLPSSVYSLLGPLAECIVYDNT